MVPWAYPNQPLNGIWLVQPFLQGSQTWQKRQTHRLTQTDRPRYSVCSSRPHLAIAAMRPRNSELNSESSTHSADCWAKQQETEHCHLVLRQSCDCCCLMPYCCPPASLAGNDHLNWSQHRRLPTVHSYHIKSSVTFKYTLVVHPPAYSTRLLHSLASAAFDPRACHPLVVNSLTELATHVQQRN